MLLAFDTYYYNDKAKTACITFENWTDEKPFQLFSEVKTDIAEYVPGEFYKRELPCILSLLKQIPAPIDIIIVDSFVYLNDEDKLGLGGHLYVALNKKIPIIGVAKTNFATLNKNKIALLRGESIRPLYITAIGISKEQAADYIKEMHGEFRLPTLLKHVDQETRI